MTENENKTEKKGKAIKPMTIVGIILCLLLLPILVINVTLIIKSYLNKDEVPSIGGIFPLIVLTDSMYPQIQSGDLIICRQLDPEDIQVGDIIAFFDPAGNGTSIVTHRVIEITEEDGELAFRTRGDANNADDRLAVKARKVVGTYQSRIPKAGNVAMFMQTTTGLILCVVLPLILLVAIDLLRSRRVEKARKQDTDALMKELEALRAKQEALSAQSSAEAKADNAEQAKAESAAEGKTPPAPEEKAEALKEDEADSAPEEDAGKKRLKPEEIGEALSMSLEMADEGPSEGEDEADETANDGESDGEGGGGVGEGGGGGAGDV